MTDELKVAYDPRPAELAAKAEEWKRADLAAVLNPNSTWAEAEEWVDDLLAPHKRLRAAAERVFLASHYLRPGVWEVSADALDDLRKALYGE